MKWLKKVFGSLWKCSPFFKPAFSNVPISVQAKQQTFKKITLQVFADMNTHFQKTFHTKRNEYKFRQSAGGGYIVRECVVMQNAWRPSKLETLVYRFDSGADILQASDNLLNKLHPFSLWTISYRKHMLGMNHSLVRLSERTFQTSSPSCFPFGCLIVSALSTDYQGN